MTAERAIQPYERTRPTGYEKFTDDRNSLGYQFAHHIPAADVINLHWVATLLDYESFFAKVPRTTALVWTLHDMNVFTGGCHYDDGCGRFQDQCGACPQLGSMRPMDLSWEIWRRKKNIFASLAPQRLHIVTPSRWLAQEISRSSILGDRFPVSVIPYGVDTVEFSPRDKKAAREILGVPLDARVVLFGAHNVETRRKGGAALAEALGMIAGLPGLFVLTFGGGQPTLPPAIPSRHVPYVSDDRLLSMIFSAADVLVAPSIQDNLPAVVLEAMACGLPVIGCATGGVPDAVRPGVTGALVPPGDAVVLATAVRTLLGQPERLRELQANCRHVAVHEYALRIQAERYIELYAALEAPESHAPALPREEPVYAETVAGD
jgi:glycosyltransferase involved in cell wall biosynthesis